MPEAGHDVSPPRVLQGSCLCGAVKYTVLDEFEYALNCHCSQCRRATGSAFKPFGGIARSKLAVSSGEPNLMRFGGDEAHDIHCGSCGSLLYSVLNHGARVHVTYGTLTDAPSLSPTAHIFVRSKATWHVIGDDLPQYDEFN
jgi:hypothetical protein